MVANEYGGTEKRLLFSPFTFELKMQDKDAQAQKEQYAAARKAAEQKAADFDKVREAARALNKELEEKNHQLKDQQAVVTRLAVSQLPDPLSNFTALIRTYTVLAVQNIPLQRAASLLKVWVFHIWYSS
jgi:hypothetical protein